MILELWEEIKEQVDQEAQGAQADQVVQEAQEVQVVQAVLEVQVVQELLMELEHHHQDILLRVLDLKDILHKPQVLDILLKRQLLLKDIPHKDTLNRHHVLLRNIPKAIHHKHQRPLKHIPHKDTLNKLQQLPAIPHKPHQLVLKDTLPKPLPPMVLNPVDSHLLENSATLLKAPHKATDLNQELPLDNLTSLNMDTTIRLETQLQLKPQAQVLSFPKLNSHLQALHLHNKLLSLELLPRPLEPLSATPQLQNLLLSDTLFHLPLLLWLLPQSL